METGRQEVTDPHAEPKEGKLIEFSHSSLSNEVDDLSYEPLYRYMTIRDWRQKGESAHAITWIGSHPGVVKEPTGNDNTTDRALQLTELWGYNHMTVVNIFALRCRTMWRLKHCSNPIGMREENDESIIAACRTADLVVACWGNAGELFDRGDRVLEMITSVRHPIHVLGRTNKGQPMHLSYVKKTVRLKAWSI